MSLRDGIKPVIITIVMALASQTGFADTLPAGSEIVNQAAVTYKDAKGIDQVATTNEVILKVQQVYSTTLAQDNQQFGIIAGEVVFFHTLTNIGNGPDRYKISIQDAMGDAGEYQQLQVYFDQDNNGEINPTDPVLASTAQEGILSLDIDLKAGDQVQLLVVGTLPNSANEGDQFDSLLTVKSFQGGLIAVDDSVTDISSGIGLGGLGGHDGLDDTNLDSVVVTNNAVLVMNKSSSYDDNGTLSTVADDRIDYSITITNKGAQTAFDSEFIDVIPNNTLFISGSLGSSGDFIGAVGDDGFNGTDGFAPIFDSGTNRILAQIDQLGINNSVTINFSVSIAPNTIGNTKILNTASVDGELDNNPVTDEDIVASNTTLDQVALVPPIPGVDFIDTGENVGNDGVNDGKDEDASNDIQLVMQVPENEAIIFKHRVVNTGDSVDSYDLAVINSTFPVNSTFIFYSEDGQTPLLDTNSNAIVDTGTVNPGDSKTITVKVFIPSGSNITVPQSATLRAISTIDKSVFDDTAEQLNALTDARVDLANDVGTPVAGFNDSGNTNAHPSNAITTTVTANPGDQVVFDLMVANEGDSVDSYILEAFADITGTQPLDSSFQLKFRDSLLKNISNTGSVIPNTVFNYQAMITLPEDIALSSLTPIFFKVTSLITGSSDIKQDAVMIRDASASIALTPDQRGTVLPCASRRYEHRLINNGERVESVVVEVANQSSLSHQLLLPTTINNANPSGFTAIQNLTLLDSIAVLSAATNTWSLVGFNPGRTPSELAIGLQPLDQTVVKVQILAPCNTPLNTQDTLVLRAISVDETLSVINTDVTAVSRVDLIMTKAGAIDADCDGVPDDNIFDSSTIKAAPGECVIWQIISMNSGVDAICDVTIKDAAPDFTQLVLNTNSPLVFSNPSPGVGSCSVNVDTIACQVGNSFDITGDNIDENYCLRAGEQSIVRFGVQIE